MTIIVILKRPVKTSKAMKIQLTKGRGKRGGEQRARNKSVEKAELGEGSSMEGSISGKRLGEPVPSRQRFGINSY
jgi:hypothetical protein